MACEDCRSVGLGSVKNSEKPMEGKGGRWTRKEGSGGNRSRGHTKTDIDALGTNHGPRPEARWQ